MTFKEILEQEQKQRNDKLAAKLPEWTELGIDIPSSLALEQCSSSITSKYKASVALSFLGKEQLSRVIDITGGLGVDSAAFSKISEQVEYYERNAELAEAASSNAVRIGIKNIAFHAQEVDLGTRLAKADLVFADPARRGSAGKKVFKLEDCSPKILELLPHLYESSDYVMLKLSPMADVTQLARELGEELREVHLVGVGSELKEILCLLKRGSSGDYVVKAVQVGTQDELTFYPEEERQGACCLAESIQAGDFLLEPLAALKKSGAYKLICSHFGLSKLDISTHLYHSRQKLESELFRHFRVLDILPFNKANFKLLAATYPKAEIKAYNLPISSDELRAKLKLKSGGDVHIFACNTAYKGRVFIVCTKLNPRRD